MESRKTTTLGAPRLSLDIIDSREKGTLWIPYHPRSSDTEYPKKLAQLPYVMARLADLTETALDIQDLFFSKAYDIHEIWVEASRLYKRLEAFLENTAIVEEQPVPHLLFLP
jgi:hypothetical protein